LAHKLRAGRGDFTKRFLNLCVEQPGLKATPSEYVENECQKEEREDRPEEPLIPIYR
jgi:hypothetical protein